MRICEVKNCGGKHCARGYCQKHYYRYKQYGNPLGSREDFKNKGKKCKIEICENDATRKEMCDKHYRKFMKYNDPLFGYEIEFHGLSHMPEYYILHSAGKKYVFHAF